MSLDDIIRLASELAALILRLSGKVPKTVNFLLISLKYSKKTFTIETCMGYAGNCSDSGPLAEIISGLSVKCRPMNAFSSAGLNDVPAITSFYSYGVRILLYTSQANVPLRAPWETSFVVWPELKNFKQNEPLAGPGHTNRPVEASTLTQLATTCHFFLSPQSGFTRLWLSGSHLILFYVENMLFLLCCSDVCYRAQLSVVKVCSASTKLMISNEK